MDTSPILHFVSAWTAHYHPGWFQSHTVDYQCACTTLEQLASSLNQGIRSFDPTILNLRPKDMIPDVQPDDPSLRIYIAPEGMRPIPVGYYLCIRSSNRSFLSGGLYSSMFASAADLVRDQIISDPLAWDRLIQEPAFREQFLLLGRELNKFPDGYDPGHPHAKYLQQNNWYVRYPIQDATLLVPDALEAVALQMFSTMSPLVQFLNHAMRGFRLRD